uniref:Uncharacterized protein n=1 Tax=Cacopsylla melanoneura TaxID=428564 RepID=A0A8D8YXI7_9HEMI
MWTLYQGGLPRCSCTQRVEFCTLPRRRLTRKRRRRTGKTAAAPIPVRLGPAPLQAKRLKCAGHRVSTTSTSCASCRACYWIICPRTYTRRSVRYWKNSVRKSGMN